MISKHHSFVIPSVEDISSFVQLCIFEKWAQGAKVLLTSAAAHATLSLAGAQGLADLCEKMISAILSIEDVKLRRQFSLSVVEDVLTKRPYVRTFAYSQLLQKEGSLSNSEWFDLPRLSKECLKSLNSEDLRLLYITSKD